MNYNNGFPMNYPYLTQPVMPQPQPQPQPQMQVQNNNGNGFIYVQGESGAKAYMVAPGNTVLLMDSEDPVFYLKSTDISGIPKMRIFDYKERDPENQKKQVNASKKQIKSLENQIEEMNNRIDELQEQLNKIINKDNSDSSGIILPN